MHYTLIALNGVARQIFSKMKAEGTVPCRIRAVDLRHLLLFLPFLLHDLFHNEVAAWNSDTRNPRVVDPSSEIVLVCLSLIEWYHLYRRSGKSTDDLSLLDWLALALLRKFETTFPYLNKKGQHIMATDKVHFIIHSAGEIFRWGDIINCSAEAMEETHRTWIKAQGNNTNQGPSSAGTMMRHSQRKLAARDLAHAIQGIFAIKPVFRLIKAFSHVL